MKLSVIVCTRNRAHAIIPCLDSIAASLAHATPVDAEIVVVDNGSTDDTSARVREWAATSAFPVNLQFEPRTGTAKARNCGIRAARGDLLVWTDDDCRMDKNHISVALRHDASDTELVLRGGRIELGDSSDLPLSLKRDKITLRWKKEYSSKNEDFGGALLGANMMMRRALIDKLGLFDERFGPGSGIPAGEETDLIFRAYLANIKIEYIPDMVVYHHHGRKTAAEGYNLLRNYMVAVGAISAKHFFNDPNCCRAVYWDFKNALREIKYGKNNYKPELGFSYKSVMVCYALGATRYLIASMRKTKRAKQT